MKSISVSRSRAADVATNLPALEPLNSLPSLDLLVCACGFEDRVKDVPNRYLEQAKLQKVPPARNLLVAQYTTNKDDNAPNEPVFIELADQIGVRLKSFAAEKPSEILGAVTSAIGDIAGSGHSGQPVVVGVDISGASSNLIASILYACMHQRITLQLFVLYTEAEEYSPTKEQYDLNRSGLIYDLTNFGTQDSEIEYGISDVESNELYPGFHKASKGHAAVVVAGYRSERFVRCISKTNEQILATPSQSLHWILGAPPDEENSWRVDLSREVATQAIQKVCPEGDEFRIADESNCSVCSTLDYRHVFEALVDYADMNLGSNLSLINFGSKMQAVGCALALAARPEYAVTTARPTAFVPAHYSKQSGKSWMIDFGLAPTLLANLQKIGTLVCEASK